MDFSIQGSRPIWQQLMEQLARRIITGVYPQGSRFPAVRELAAEAGVNPNTMQRALGAMEGTGLLVTNRTAGRYVTEDRARLDAIRLTLARDCMAEYLNKMKTLGYSEEEARNLLLEEQENGR